MTVEQAVRREVEHDDPELLKEVDAERDDLYPKPDVDGLLELRDTLRTDFATWHQTIMKNREVRYLQDKLPEKWQKNLQDGRRVFTRLSHNEIMRVVAMQTRNPWKVNVPPRGGTSAAQERAKKQTRWLNQLLPALERATKQPIRRQVADCQAGDSLGIWFVYLTDAYDKLGIEERRFDESDKDYLGRTEEALQGAGLPFGVRRLDPLSVVYEMGEEGIEYAFIDENKTTRSEMRRLKKAGLYEVYENRAAATGKPGFPINGATREQPSRTVQCTHYYDARWYAYWVDGVLAEGPVEHNMPGVPLVLQQGLVTGSPNASEALQGITWGMADMEKALNDVLTLELDNSFVFGKPKAVIETEASGQIRSLPEHPFRLDLQQPGVPELLPGQHIQNAFKDFQPYPTVEVKNTILSLWQRSGLNPIAQGESPGSDPAGYTVNSLQGAAQNLYEGNLDNEARAAGELCDYVRLLIRDTIGLPVYLSTPMADRRKGGTEWLGLGPDDVDETPAVVWIDPMSDVNRLALQQSLRQGNKEGYVTRRRVQEQGFGIDDPAAEDDEMLIDQAVEQLAALALEEAKATIFAAQQPAGPVILGPDGNPLPPSGMGPGGAPAQPQPPTVGGPQAEASRAFGREGGPAALQSSTALAGQGRAHVPPEGTFGR